MGRLKLSRFQVTAVDIKTTLLAANAIILSANKKELHFVRWVASLFSGSFARFLSITITRLGNGWIYAIVLLLALDAGGPQALAPLMASMSSVCLSFLTYSIIKPSVRRMRPYDCDVEISTPIKALDTYSFPSGHCMTFAAVALPILLVFPNLILFFLPFGLLMAWARLSLGHHYPSDVAFGSLIGLCSGLMCSEWISRFYR